MVELGGARVWFRQAQSYLGPCRVGALHRAARPGSGQRYNRMPVPQPCSRPYAGGGPLVARQLSTPPSSCSVGRGRFRRFAELDAVDRHRGAALAEAEETAPLDNGSTYLAVLSISRFWTSPASLPSHRRRWCRPGTALGRAGCRHCVAAACWWSPLCRCALSWSTLRVLSLDDCRWPCCTFTWGSPWRSR